MSKIANLQRFSFNNSEGQDEIVLVYNTDEIGDTVISDTYFEVTNLSEGAVLNAVGYTLKNSAGVAMKFVDISNVGVVESIEQNGIYMIMSSALERLEVQCTGDCDVVVKRVL